MIFNSSISLFSFQRK